MNRTREYPVEDASIRGNIMSKHHKHNKPGPFQEKAPFRQATPSQGQETTDMTPGRDPAEGPDVEITSPSHERWAEGTPERDPTEGPEM